MANSNGKTNVLLGVTGSIAAYKSADLARDLIKRGLNVRVVMTQAATEFISALTFEVLTGNPVVVDFCDSTDLGGIGHIELASWADVVAVVPATADTIAKMAGGYSENELLATLLVTRAPVIIAPAMNVNMLEHPATQENITKLKERGIKFIEAEEGKLACGWSGTGRLASTYEIFYSILRELRGWNLKGKRVVITAGPTREMIDPVRFISNCSSGKMGVEVAKEAYLRGADVTLIHGQIKFRVPKEIKRVPILSANDLHEAAIREVYESEDADIVVMTAAVADYRPAEQVEYKIKKEDHSEDIKLALNPDVLQALGERRGEAKVPFLVGFAVETGEPEDLIEKVQKKIVSKKVDMVVGNLAHEAFDKNTNHVWIVDSIGRQEEVSTTFKSRVARKIFDTVSRLS